MINNPIIQREFIGTLRGRRALVAQVVLVVALAALVLVRWPSEARVDYSGEQAQQVLRVFGYGLMTVLILLAPVFPATSIVLERQKGTLALLLNSPMNPWSIALGKLVGVIGFIALLLVLSLPAAAACYAMGGIDLPRLGMIYLVLFLLAVEYATLGLLVSSYARSTDSALRTTYGIILVLAVVLVGPYEFLADQAWVPDTYKEVSNWLRSVSPIPAVMHALGDVGLRASGKMEATDISARFSLIAIVLSVIFTSITAMRMNMRIFDDPRDAGKVTDEQSSGVQIYRRIMYLWFFDPNRRSGLISKWQNPVMVKEQRSSTFGRGHWMMRLIGACLVISLGLMLLASWQSAEMELGRLGGIMVLLQVALIVLVTPAMASGLISGERESGGWRLLQMTPMSPFTIVSGKLLSVAVTVTLILLATLPGYAVLLVIQPAQQPVVINVLISLVLTAVMALLVSAAISSLFVHTAAATATSYGVLLTLCAGTLLLWLAEDAPFTHATVENVLMVNPLAAALSLIEAPGFNRYDLVPANWWITGGIAVVSLVVLTVQTWRLTRPR